jgi:hypothetical protein
LPGTQGDTLARDGAKGRHGCGRVNSLKEWAYAGFAFDLGSALIAHFAVGDGPQAWGWAAATGVLWGLSYFFWRRLKAAPASPYRAVSTPVRD